MRKTNAIKYKIYQLILVPSALALLLLSIAFLVLENQSVHNHQSQRDVFVRALFSQTSGQKTDIEKVQKLAVALLSTEGFRTLAILDKNLQPLWSQGLPLSPFSSIGKTELRDVLTNSGNFCAKGKCYLTLPITIDRAQMQPPHTLLVVTEDSRLAVKKYQFFIALLVVAMLALSLSYFFVRKFLNTMLQPLEKIYSGIQRYISGNFDKPIAASSSNIYGDLVNGINQLATLQQTAQENLQQSIEQSTAELRETLETVEIQNIELDIARKSALQASRVKSEFLANTSHEIRTPLNGIIGFSELLKKTDMNSQQQEYLETIDESAKGLLTIINDIMDFSRLEIGKLTLEYKPVRLRQVIEEALRLQAPAAHEKKLRLLTIIDHDIPEHLLGDPLRLKQVLSNLLSNAIKFTHSGHILVSVSKEDRPDNQISLQFRITDSGIGLNQDQQEELFDAFTQLDSSESRAYGGTGLGLAIAKGLVDRMKGQIGVESEPGKGATFWFTSTLGRNPNSANTASYLTGTLRNIRAVVYDCSNMSRAEITHYIRGWGAEVSEISRFDDIEAKTEEACRTGPIHLAILDAQMNEKTFDRIKLRQVIDILNQAYSIPVIVLASPAIQRMIEPALASSHSSCILRPIFCNRLHQTVCEQLGIIIPESESDRPTRYEPQKQAQEINILAVDDNPANLKLVCELLKDLKVNVVAVASGAEALNLCKQSTFDLILMDIQMPGMDGLEATRELRKRENPDFRTPVVALTAHAANEQKAKLLLAGMDDYLTKPVSENELKHIIDRWVSRNPHRTLPNLSVAQRKAKSEPQLIDEDVDESEKLINIAQSLSLAKNKPALARDMLSMLLESLPKTQSDINTFLAEGNHKELQEVIHKLHGGCCYCGVPRLKKYSEELDAKLQSAQQNNETPPMLEEKIAHLNTVIDEMLAWKESVDIDALFPDEGVA